MIIFGWGRQTIKNIGIVFKNLCSHCHNEEFWVMTRTITWFTLFFVPVIPYKTEYFLSCPVCKYGLTLDHKQVEELKPIAETNQLLIDGKITQDEHQELLRLKQLNSNSEESVQAEVIEAKIKDGTELSFCYDCGQQLTKELKFCGNCGTQVIPK